MASLGRLASNAAKWFDTLVRSGVPESTAQKIVSGDLPMDYASRMQRAREQGYDTSRTLYHGTPYEDITAFRLGPHDETSINSLSLTDDPRYAGDYAMGGYGRHSVDGGYLDESGRLKDWVGEGLSPSIMPVHVKGSTPDFMDAIDEFEAANKGLDWNEDTLPAFLADRGAHGVEMFGDEVAMLDPSAIRSKYAAFDPDNAGKNTLLGGLGGAAVLGGAMAPQDAQAGQMRAPAHPWLAEAIMAARGVGRSLEGSPASMLYPEGTINWLDRLSYGDRPTGGERLGAVLDWF